MFAGGGLAATALAVAAIVIAAAAGSGSGDGGDSHEKGGATGSGAKHRTLVRNAAPQADWRPFAGPVPILEYHVLGQPPAEAPYPELYVGRTEFSREMDWLEENGYQAVTLEQVEDAWYRGGRMPPKPVVLSFDDGYRPQFTFALPELRKHGWAGVLNLKAEGSELYESNVRAMIAAGWELAAHTINHSDLTTLDAAALEEEVAGSRRILRREYHVPVEDFCYPAGAFDETVIAAVEEAGYAGATTEIPGYASPETPYELDRYEILGSSGVSGMAEDLASGA
jgi:peptidoglycan/xylan/chitin deacetylase (PgdA/CDA1 family)